MKRGKLMRLTITRAARVAVASALLAAGLSAVSAQPASAADSCLGWMGNRENGDGSGIIKEGTWNLKTGPYSTCDNAYVVHGGAKMWWMCMHNNIYGVHWVYGRMEGTNKKGWISYDNFASIDSSDDNHDGEITLAWC
ncbi:hypothetical protein [Actinoplanes sp. NPDC049681]|uniref:DUF7155 family protein n=1 Tax=Actinoplanes sp. NPDC049681 TaxID=3363905 RepID=UPI0037A5B358